VLKCSANEPNYFGCDLWAGLRAAGCSVDAVGCDSWIDSRLGFLICVADLPLAGWLAGLVIALLISVPSAVITKAYAPILGTGAVAGIIIGIIRVKFGR